MRLVIALAVIALGCDGPSPQPKPTPEIATPQLASTIHRADYVGPAACGDCHVDQHARWSASLHRKMNQRAEPAAVIGDFSGTIVRYAGGEARFTKDATGYAMALARKGVRTQYRITRTIGVRGLQEYVGIAEGKTEEVRLPFGWWPRRGGWYAQPFFDPWLDEAAFDPYSEVTDPWAERCPWCHSTYPFEQRIARASARPIGHGLEQYFTSTPGTERLGVEQQITTGISCESCHLGGRAHAAGAPIHLVPVGATPGPDAPAPTRFVDEKHDARIVNATCAQCHSGPSPRLADGSSLRNSSESIDLAASPCVGIRCIDCHDPHRADARADQARAIAACTTCHTGLAPPAVARRHAGVGHASATCLDCHMPRMVLGIDSFVRSHRISSPTDVRLLATAGPNACNLCHLDQPIGWTLDGLARGWNVRIAPSVTAYGSADTTVGEVWLAAAQPAMRLIAIAAYGRTRDPEMLPTLVQHLADPVAYLRAWTVFAIEDILGRNLRDDEYDPRAAPADREKAIAKLRALHR